MFWAIGECHTPRNAIFAMQKDQHLKGFVIEGTEAPDISAEGPESRGWKPHDLHAFLATGLAPQGTVHFGTLPVLTHSTKYLTDKDRDSMVTYLMRNKLPQNRPSGKQHQARSWQPGATFMSACGRAATGLKVKVSLTVPFCCRQTRALNSPTHSILCLQSATDFR